MIRAHLRRNIASVFSWNSPFIDKSGFSYSISVHHLSTVGVTKHLKASALLELLQHKYKFSPEVASHVDSVLNLSGKTPERCDSMLSYLKEVGFTSLEMEKMLKSIPKLLLANVDKGIKPKIKIFKDLGFSSRDITYIISTGPSILHYSAEKRILPALLLLKDLLGSYKKVAKSLRKSGGWLLMTNLEKTMVPNIKFLQSCGLEMERIQFLVNYNPRMFLYNPDTIRKIVEKVDEMGVDRNSRMFVYAVGIVGSMTNEMWELKLQAFRRILKFSDEDISRVFRRAPHALIVSEDKLKKVKEVLLATGRYNTLNILQYPGSLKYSIDGRYKPRIEVLAILEKRHLIKKWPCLGGLSKMPDVNFFNVFVGPYLKDPEILAWCKDHPLNEGWSTQNQLLRKFRSM